MFITKHSILWKLRFKLITRVPRVISFIAKYLSINFASKLILKTLQFDKKSPHLIICFTRERFTKDLRVLRDFGNLNYGYIPNSFVGRVLSRFIPSAMTRQTAFGLNYELYQDNKNLQKGTKLVEKIVENIIAIQSNIIFLSANTDYFQDGLFRIVCRKKNIPFLVLCRENPVTDIHKEHMKQHYKLKGYKADITAMAVFSKHAKTLFAFSGIIDDSKIFVTGAPRIDPWIFYEKDIPQENLVTIISFAIPYGAQETFIDLMHQIDILSKDPKLLQFKFILKCRDKNDFKLMQSVLTQDTRIKLTINSYLPELLSASKIVIGFQSLAIVEALLSKAKIIIPYWDQTRRTSKALLIPNNLNTREIIDFPESMEELSSIMLNYSQNTNLNKDHISKRFELFINYFDYDPKNLISATKRVEDFICHHLSKT